MFSRKKIFKRPGRSVRPGERPVSEEGFTLIEAMFAITFLSIGLLAIAQLIPLASSQIVSSRNHTLAVEMAQRTLESLQAAPFNDVALTDGTHTASIDRRDLSYTIQDDVPVPGTKRVDLQVTWVEPGGNKTITYSTILTP